MAYKTWPTADQQHDEQGRSDVFGNFLLNPATGQPYDSTNPIPIQGGATLLDSFSPATSITAATTFSGVPTIGQLAANSSVLLANPGDQATFLVQISVSAFVGTLSFYGLEPDGSTLQLINAHLRNSTTIANSTAINTASALNQVWQGGIAGFKSVYVVCTAFTSGSASVQLGLSAAPYAKIVLNTVQTNITQVNGTAPQLDGASSNRLGTSLYGKGNGAAGDTAILLDASGHSLIRRDCVAVYTLASTATSGSTQNSGDLTVGPYTEISIDINTTAQAGTSPTLQLFWERKGADGIYYIVWQTAVLTAATNTISTSIGAGMAYNQSLGVTGRLRWVVGGSATPTYTFSANVYGK